ncbi:hypothetical protein ACFOLJ_00105 [Rugamonas sp. CCM 8940]|uniref:hypothetical protein n=1 Tax=Rugamonas sp. CCM 8940 TaxID=2765359 RepID=UPI00361089C4
MQGIVAAVPARCCAPTGLTWPPCAAPASGCWKRAARAAAADLAQVFQRYDAGARFDAVLREMLSMPA